MPPAAEVFAGKFPGDVLRRSIFGAWSNSMLCALLGRFSKHRQNRNGDKKIRGVGIPQLTIKTAERPGGSLEISQSRTTCFDRTAKNVLNCERQLAGLGT